MLLIFQKCKRPVLIEAVNLKGDNTMINVLDQDNYNKLMSQIKLHIHYIIKIMKICCTFKKIDKKIIQKLQMLFF